MGIFLVKGVKLQGVITAFDPFSIQLSRDGTVQLVYKHAIATISPIERPEGLETVISDDGGGKAMLQDQFLAAATRDDHRMGLFLMNGVMLQGRVTAYDQFCLLLERGSQVQLVYKHAISTLQPGSRREKQPADEREAEVQS